MIFDGFFVGGIVYITKVPNQTYRSINQISEKKYLFFFIKSFLTKSQLFVPIIEQRLFEDLLPILARLGLLFSRFSAAQKTLVLSKLKRND